MDPHPRTERDQDTASTAIDRNGLEILDASECRRLLSTATLGRVGVSIRALPAVLPVNYFLDRDQILIATTPGTKVAAALSESVVAFEVDDIDPIDHSGWSVMVTGVARVVDHATELERIARLPLPHWAPAPGTHIIGITIDVISGRRIPEQPTERPGRNAH